MTTRLPVVLESLRIATPCQADWDDMKGDNRVRFCGRCEKNVYNLSAMSRTEAEALVGAKEGRMCVRLYQRTDGTVLTSDCPVGVRRARLRHRVWASVSGVAASMALAFGIFSGRARADLSVTGEKHPTPQPQATHVAMGGAVARPPEMLMGKIKMPDPPKPPKKPQAKMGEPAPIMGDIAIVEPTTK
jgi:hypothetical protein